VSALKEKLEALQALLAVGNVTADKFAEKLVTDAGYGWRLIPNTYDVITRSTYEVYYRRGLAANSELRYVIYTDRIVLVNKLNPLGLIDKAAR
jgi:hypothetical protein